MQGQIHFPPRSRLGDAAHVRVGFSSYRFVYRARSFSTVVDCSRTSPTPRQ